MDNNQSIAVLKNMLFSLKNTLKYRKEKGDNVMTDEYMLPEALETVLSMAESFNSQEIIQKIITKDNTNA